MLRACQCFTQAPQKFGSSHVEMPNTVIFSHFPLGVLSSWPIWALHLFLPLWHSWVCYHPCLSTLLHFYRKICACVPWVHLIPPFAASWHSKLTLLWDFGWSVSPLSRWWEQHKGGGGAVNVSMSGKGDREHLSLAHLPWPRASMTRPE